ncbi:hypothetical protein [Homoserinimonas aerilata]|uniref:hypothetical protein n=1 Tax=Homoserinimonas aerilata TaxID=1162970 RepID=UPI001153B53B|nr:hypothetical protein [Homoserinimonas aerilata]
MSSSHSTWSSTLLSPGTTVSVPLARSYTAIDQLETDPVDTFFLNAMRVPSGDSDGHSTLLRSDTMVRFARSPRTNQVLPPDAAVA